MLGTYAQDAAVTDRLDQDDLSAVLMGLFGEVGTIMSTAKKYLREEAAYTGYRQDLVEEFGDTLWYFTALCRRLGSRPETYLPHCDDFVGNAQVNSVPANLTLRGIDALLKLGRAAAALLDITQVNSKVHDLLQGFCRHYFQALAIMNVEFSDVVCTNIRKTHGRFLDPQASTLPTFDSHFAGEERLPDHFEIKITQRDGSRSYLQWNGVFIGDPLTDNILDPDGYRFHDVFHFAHAAILHWSPTFRALIKQKRKSDPVLDETQDGGRAIVVEEGLTAWIFSCAKEIDLFDGHTSVSFDLLKTVRQFVQVYEVERCPLKLWEDAILSGFEVFRLVRRNNGGVVVGDRSARTIRYRALDEGIV